MRSGEFTVGDFSLFVVYLSDLMWFPDEIARWFITYRQASVSLARLARLQAPADPRLLVAELPPNSKAIPGIATGHVSLPSPVSDGSVLHPAEVGARAVALPADEGIDRVPMLPLLEAINLSYRYPGSNRGIHHVSLRLDRGSFVVLTGPIGAGKTTILQALLGLLPRESGEIYWQGEPVADPTSFFGPPRTAYVPQVPKLFSETFRSNLEQGLTTTESVLEASIHRAVIERDLAGLPAGLETFVGPRGTRLSGGQVQRAAAARAFLREPDLIVVDDLSSALDVETEETLWDRLAAWRQETPGLTILAVSHRPAAFRRADRVVVLEDGKIVG
jgi:ATP-binding cassette, subfamily B, bacterial